MEFPRQNRSNLGYILGDHIMLDFAAGCVLALLYSKIKIRVRAIFFFGVVIFITWAAFRLKMPTKYLDFLFSVSIVLFAVISYPAKGLVKTCLMKVGDASYSIYLSHIYFVYLLLELVEGKGNTTFYYIILSISILALSIVFGMAIHRFIEAPLLNYLKALTISRRRVANQDG
jgi:peptidoglycan/LPS O-acetylase OafA/YrhL